jgi:hypothetical protein
VWKSDLYHFAQLVFREPGQDRQAPGKKPGPSQPEKKASDTEEDESKPASMNIGNAAYAVTFPSSHRCRVGKSDNQRRFCQPAVV